MIEKRCKVVKFHETGNSKVLKIESEALREPGDDEIRIKADAIGLNRAEVMFRSGVYLEQPVFPARLGYEVSGVVDAVGKVVTGFEIGDKVSTIPAFSMGEYGVYAEYPIVPANAVAKYPTNLSAAEGTSIWMQYITAWGALIDIGKLQAGQTVLITAASSSVGIAAIQIANLLGAKVIATTRTRQKSVDLMVAGAHCVIATDEESLDEKVAEITDSKGVNIIFDPIGGPLLMELGACSAKGAKIIEYGALDERQSLYPLFDALGKGLSIIGYTLFEVTQQPDKLNEAKSFVYQHLESGELQPLLDKRFAFDDIQQAHEYMESNSQVGKIVVEL